MLWFTPPTNPRASKSRSDVMAPRVSHYRPGLELPRRHQDFADRESTIPVVHGIENPEVPKSDIPRYVGSYWWCHLPLSGFGESRVPSSLSPCTRIFRVPNPEIPRSYATCPVDKSTVPIESGNRYSRFQRIWDSCLYKRRSPISRWCLDLLVPKG